MTLRATIAACLSLAVACSAGCLQLRRFQEAFDSDVYSLFVEPDYVAPEEHRTVDLQPSESAHDFPVNPDARLTAPPRRLLHPSDADVRDMSLEEALHLALMNNPVIRTSNEFLAPRAPLLGISDQTASVSAFDPAIQASNVAFGRRGVNAALADFDATYRATFQTGISELVQNSPTLNIAQGQVLEEQSTTVSQALTKTFATGARMTLQNDWTYSKSNQTRLFPSAYTGFVRAELRQPLWAGSGVDYTRIAGPVFNNFGTPTNLTQGVLIARINEDISLSEFEISARDLLKQAEDLYWDLYLSYRRYDVEVVARNSAARNLRGLQLLKGRTGTGAGTIALAEENYFDAKERVETALAVLYETEARLRRLMGLPVSDGSIIRPSDRPATASLEADWNISLAEALTRRTELRRQKLNIESLALQMRAARSLVQPQLDLVSRYQTNIFGDKFFGEDDLGTGGNRRGALASIGEQGENSWTVGLEMNVPLGYRTAYSQVTNLELRIAKARATLREQELEISHELASAFQNIDRFYTTAQTALNRRNAAVTRVRAAEGEREFRELSTEGVDLRLRADIALRDAELAYFTNLVEYTKSISDLHYRKGTLLDFNNVQLAEGAWHPKAYADAFRRALARTYAEPASYKGDAPRPNMLPVETPPASHPMWTPPIVPHDAPVAPVAPSRPAETDDNAVPPPPGGDDSEEAPDDNTNPPRFVSPDRSPPGWQATEEEFGGPFLKPIVR